MKDIIVDGLNRDEGFIKNNNFKLISISDTEVVMEYLIKKDGLNTLKIVHGGLLFGLCDTAAGTLACMTGKFPMTINANINYLSPAKGKKLIAKASILKLGNNIGYYKVDVYDEKDNYICTSNIEMYLKSQ